MLARLLAFISFLRRLLRRVIGVGIARTAASLAFTTLLGLVPLLTVAFAYVARFPLFERSQDALESFLLRYFLPGSGAVVRQYLAEFVAKSAELKGVGTFFVILTVVLLAFRSTRRSTPSGARASRVRSPAAASSTRLASPPARR